MIKFLLKNSIIFLSLHLGCFAEDASKIKNLDDLTALAKQGNSNALCLLGIQEFLGGQIYDSRIIETVTVQQILLSKRIEWSRRIKILSVNEDNHVIKTGEKIKSMINYLKQSAEMGNKVGLFCYGVCLEKGIGIQRNVEEAFKYYLKSAENGFLPAFSEVGKSFQDGSGVSVDRKKAIDWFMRGEEAGDVESKVNLGRAYLNGLGVEKNEEKGFNIIKKASENGSSTADSELGYCYLYGVGTDKDFGKAFLLLKQASESDIWAKTDLGLMYLRGQGTPKDEAKGFRLIEEAVETDSSYAQYILGTLYKAGEGVPRNSSKAKVFFEKSASKGNHDSMFELACTYYLGDGETQKNREKAIDLLKKSEALGNKNAKELLIQIKEGDIVETPFSLYTEAMDALSSSTDKKDKKNAVKKLEMASNSGFAFASFELGKQLIEGINIDQNIERAIKLFLEVANSNRKEDENARAKALNYLGYLYDQGSYLDKDYEKAFEKYQNAALLNHSGAIANIGLYYYYGKKGEKNYSEALKYFLQSVENLTDEAGAFKSQIMCLIGLIYCSHEKDIYEGNKWLLRATSLKHPAPHAFRLLAFNYLHGRGADKNREKAVELLKKGAEMGDEQSINAIAKIEKGQDIP